MVIKRDYEGLSLSIELTEEELNNAYLERKNELDCQEVYDTLTGWDLGEILKSCKFPYPGHAYILDERIEEAEIIILKDKKLLSDIYDKFMDFNVMETGNYNHCMEWACDEMLEKWGKENPDFLDQFKDIDAIAYEKYKKAWVKKQNYSPEFLAWIRCEYEEAENESGECICFEEYIDKNGFGGECYVCFDEFLGAEYQDKEYMKELLTEEEYAKYCFNMIVKNAKEAALRDGYDQLIIREGNAFSFVRAANGKPCTPILGEEKIIGKVAVSYENGVRNSNYKKM